MRTITIKPKAITHNLNQVKQRAPQSKVLAMVKSNAYGHGVAAVLPALQQADGIGVNIRINTGSRLCICNHQCSRH